MGLRLGKGEALDDIIASMTAVAEGVLTSRSAHLLAKKVSNTLFLMPLLVLRFAYLLAKKVSVP